MNHLPFSIHNTSEVENWDCVGVVESLLQPRVVSLPGHIQAVFVQSVLKIFGSVASSSSAPSGLSVVSYPISYLFICPSTHLSNYPLIHLSIHLNLFLILSWIRTCWTPKLRYLLQLLPAGTANNLERSSKPSNLVCPCLLRANILKYKRGYVSYRKRIE